MKISILSASKAGFRITGIVFVAAIISTGSAAAETYRHGNSTATIEQSGGSGKSESQIRRYRDGQKIITQDGNSTDITIQREGGFSLPEYNPDNSREYPDYFFYRRSIEERFSRIDPDDRRGADTGDDFKQRMLNRMRSDFRH